MTGGGRLVVDASVAIKWYVPEPGSVQATALLGAGHLLLAPDLLIAEFGNILWKKIGRGELTALEAEAIVHGLVSASPVTLVESTTLLPGALDIALRFGRTVYDSLYLALAVTEGCRLITDDQRLDHALRGTPLAPFVQSLSGT